MATVLKVLDEPGSPVVMVTVDTGSLSTLVVNVPRNVYGTPDMEQLLDHALAGALDPGGVNYAPNRKRR